MKRLAAILAIGSVIGACGGNGSGTSDAPTSDDGPGTDGPGIDAPPGVFALTSPSFVEGAAIPNDLSCNGADLSPQLDWVNAPAGKLSYAIVFTDMTNNLIHSVIYDIPENLDGLPADVEQVFAPNDVPGAKQTRNFQGASSFGYAGPCPGTPHVYEFALYALDVATLPGAMMNSTQVQAKAIIEMHDLAKATLSGTYTP